MGTNRQVRKVDVDWDRKNMRGELGKLVEAAGLGDESCVGGECPCGELFLVSRVKLFVYHTLPTCTEYIEEEISDYLRFVNQRNLN